MVLMLNYQFPSIHIIYVLTYLNGIFLQTNSAQPKVEDLIQWQEGKQALGNEFQLNLREILGQK